MHEPPGDAGAPASAPSQRERRQAQRTLRLRSVAGIGKAVFAACVVAAAAWVVSRQLENASLRQIAGAIASTSLWALLACILATAVNYVCLMASEWWALAVLNKQLSIWRIALVTTVSYSASNALGFSLATGGAARLRFYSSWGLRAAEVAAVTLLAGLAVTLSGLVTAGLAMLMAGGLPAYMYAIALALLAPALIWLGRLPRSAPFFPRVRITTPPFKARAFALVGAVLEWVFNGLALFVLLPNPNPDEFAAFLAVFILGSIVSAASGAPGGIGVFEAVVLTLGNRFAHGADTAAALILFRLVSAVGPFSLVALGLTAHEGMSAIERRRNKDPTVRARSSVPRP